jgi:quinol monooxygenase YgiN
MFGLITKLRSVPGQRDALISILTEISASMPGCVSYRLAKDIVDAEALWVTEVWTDRDAHRASLALPSVQDAIRKGRPLIAGFDAPFETEPVGGDGHAGG